MTNKSRSIRWWPLFLILFILVIGLVQTWGFSEIYRQGKYLRTAKFILITIAVTLIWLIFYSRVSRKVSLSIFAFVLLAGVIIATSFRITGVDGDLLPIVEFRWKKRVPSPFAGTTATNKNLSSSLSTSTNGTNWATAFPQFMGPDRNAVLKGPALATNWTQNRPVEIWRKPVGAAWSGFAIVPPYAITQEQHGEEERTVAYHLENGAVVWAHSDTDRYATVIAGEGPRSTPTISSNKVFTYGANGILNCLELTNGKPIWSKNVWKEQGAKVPDWGVSSAPLVYNDKVIVTSGLNRSNLAAFNIKDGNKVWDANSRGADYSSPGIYKILGKEQILHFNGKGVSAFEPTDGKMLWHYDWPGGHPHIAMPVQVGESQVLISSGYGTGAELIKISRQNEEWRAERVWKSMGLKSKFAPIVVHGGYIYGLDDGIFTCLELSSGKRLWKEGRYGHGQFLLVNDLILMMAENGDVVLIKPDPNTLVELARHKVFTEKTWNPPAIIGNLLLIRNDREAVCLRLPLLF